MLDLILGLALIASNVGWWIYVRHLSGVTSDLKDAVNDVKNVTVKVSAAGDKVAAAAKTIGS